MKSSEEILQSRFHGDIYEVFNSEEIRLILSMMEEFADNQSIKFAEWVEENCWWIVEAGIHANEWKHGHEIEYATTTELLNQFKQSQK